MQNGRDDSISSTLDSSRRSGSAILLHDHNGGGSNRKNRSLLPQSSLFSITVLLLMCSAGCGSGGGSPFTDRTTEAHRVDRIEALRKKSREQPRDAGVWQELGTELLKKSGDLVQLNDPSIGQSEMILWPRAERVLDEAIHVFENALQLDSANAHLYALAGHAYLAKFRSDPVVNDTVRVVKAISLLERSIRLDPQEVDAHIDLGLALTPTWRFEGDIREAKNHLEKASSLSPDDGMVYYALSGILEVEEQYPEALRALRKALYLGLRDEVTYLELPARYQRMCWKIYADDEQDTTHHAGFFSRNLAHATRMFYRLATPLPDFFQTGVYRKADELGLRNPTFYVTLSRLYASFGRREKGFDFVLRSFELDSLSVGSYSYWYWWHYPDSIWIERFLKRMPSGSYYGYLLAAQKYRNYRQSDSAAAERLLQTAIQLQPTYGAAYVLLGQSRFHERQKAVKNFEKALSLEFHEVNSMFTAADQLLAQGDFDLAFQYYERILRLDLAPRIVVLRLMGLAYEQKKDRRTAYSTYVEMDRVCPNAILCSWWGHDAAALMSLAYADKGNYDKAIEILMRSLGNQRWQKMVRPYWRTGDPKTYATIGQLYSKKGDSKNAIAYYMKALENDAEYPEAHYGLAEEYAKTNLRDKAIDSYRRAAKLGVTAATIALQKLGGSEEAQEKR